MFGFGKKSKIQLCNQLRNLSEDASNELFEYIKLDTHIYEKCINDNPLKNTIGLFIINLYRDLLNSKYNSEDVFKVIYTTVISTAPNEEVGNFFFKGMCEFTPQINAVIEYDNSIGQTDKMQSVTDVLFGLIIDDNQYFIEELDSSIRKSTSYKKIYNYIKGIGNHSIIMYEQYNLRLK